MSRTAVSSMLHKGSHVTPPFVVPKTTLFLSSEFEAPAHPCISSTKLTVRIANLPAAAVPAGPPSSPVRWGLHILPPTLVEYMDAGSPAAQPFTSPTTARSLTEIGRWYWGSHVAPASVLARISLGPPSPSGSFGGAATPPINTVPLPAKTIDVGLCL